MSIFEEELSGGHPNSLGNTVKVVEKVLQDQKLLTELFKCYDSDDSVVRLRTSNAMKRVFKVEPLWFKSFINKFISKIPKLNQASANWTFAQLFLYYEEQLTTKQMEKAQSVIMKFLDASDDWIVLKCSMETLGKWAAEDPELKKWLMPKLRRLSKDSRKSVSAGAKKELKNLQI